jgi:hypothetical protein
MVNGYDKPPVEGTLEEVETALGIRRPGVSALPAIPKAASPREGARHLRPYIVTLLWQGGDPEEIEIMATSHADAIRRGREWKNMEYGRTQSCNTLPCRYKARLKTEEE